jgi:hypothetical protein
VVNDWQSRNCFAYALACDRGFAVALQHQPNGRSYKAVRYDRQLFKPKNDPPQPGITEVARTIGAAIPPTFVGLISPGRA